MKGRRDERHKKKQPCRMKCSLNLNQEDNTQDLVRSGQGNRCLNISSFHSFLALLGLARLGNLALVSLYLVQSSDTAPRRQCATRLANRCCTGAMHPHSGFRLAKLHLPEKLGPVATRPATSATSWLLWGLFPCYFAVPPCHAPQVRKQQR